MHRVELKVFFPGGGFGVNSVPNAPCGVESCLLVWLTDLLLYLVPNAPCGVESSIRKGKHEETASLFLMHRVELKGRG